MVPFLQSVVVISPEVIELDQMLTPLLVLPVKDYNLPVLPLLPELARNLVVPLVVLRLTELLMELMELLHVLSVRLRWIVQKIAVLKLQK